MRRHLGLPAVLSALLLAACAGGPKPVDRAAPQAPADAAPASRPSPSPPGAEVLTLDADTTLTWAEGATFTAPAGWRVTRSPALLLLEEPQRELAVGLVAVAGVGRDEAVREAWGRLRPGFALPIAQDLALPARDGWDEIGQLAYVTKTEESRVVVAVALRKARTWYVVLLDGGSAALGRRGAQVNAALESLRVPGMERESWAGKPATLDAARLAAWDAFVEEARAAAGVPGAAVAVVQGGRIVFEKGYGVRALGAGAKVTPDTLFLIGSTTKSLTTLLMARLVDRKLLDWSTPVTQILPAFALADEATTRALTVLHTVCACTGMPRQDLEFIFEYAGRDPEARLASLRQMRPTTGLGETFQYSNLMVATGGFLAGHAFAPKRRLGPAYDEAMRAEILKPLGMKATTFDFRRAARANHAEPHARGLTLEHERIPISDEEAVVAVRPAGGAWSNVRDMSRYLLLELGKGRLPGGAQIVSEASLLRRREPQVKITDESSYGLGLFVDTVAGVRVVHHGGNNAGFTTDLFFLPDHDLGVVVLANAGAANGFRGAVRRRFLELVFDGKPEAKENLESSLELVRKILAEETALIRFEPDRAWIAKLLGEYENPGLGRLAVRLEGGRAIADVGEWRSPVGQKTDRDGTVKLVLTGPPWAGIDLVPREEGGRTTLVLDAGQQVYVFAPRGR